MDRLDYVSMMCNEHAYCLAIEEAAGHRGAGARAVHPRHVRRGHAYPQPPDVAGLERYRLSALLTVLMYTFREREDLLDMYEAVSGARMHAAYFRPGGVYRDLPDTMPQYEQASCATPRWWQELNQARQGSLLDFIEDFTERFPKRVDEYETLLTDNRIWKQRTVGIGVVSPERALNLGMTGAMLRGSGIAWDLRKKQPYDVYDQVEFDIPVGT